MLDRPSLHTRRYAAVLALIAFLVMGGALWGSFTTWDDDAMRDQPSVRSPTPQNLGRLWYTPYMHTYMPVTQTLWWTAAAASKGEKEESPAWPFHLMNLFAHVLASLAAFAALRLMIDNSRSAFIGALAVAVHPVQVEAVAWISALNVVLGGLFGFITVWQYIRFVKSEDLARRRLNFVLALVAYALGVLSKPTTIAIPGVLLVVDGLILRRNWKPIAVSLVPFAMLAISCAIWSSRFQTGAGIQTLVALHWRPLVALDAVAFYIYKLIFPAWLAIDYGRHPRFAIEQWWIHVTWIIPAAIGALLLTKRRQFMVLLAAGLIFIMSLGPVLGFVPFDFQQKSTVADRYLYLPMFGFALAIAWAVRHYRIGRVAYLVPVVWMLLSVMQVQTWRDSIVLYQQQILVRPNVGLGHHNLGIELAKVGEYAEAERELRLADRLDSNTQVMSNLAKLLADQQRYPEALIYYRRVVEQLPEVSASWSNLASVLAASGNYPESRQAYRKAIELDSGNADAQIGLQHLPPATQAVAH